MMNRKEFQQYLQETIKDYLPESYADAKITFNEVVKNNDTSYRYVNCKTGRTGGAKYLY